MDSVELKKINIIFLFKIDIHKIKNQLNIRIFV